MTLIHLGFYAAAIFIPSVAYWKLGATFPNYLYKEALL